MNKCLILVDLQNDYFPGGKMELAGIEDAAGNAQLLLNEFRKKELPIVHIRHISLPPNALFFLPETDGAKINRGCLRDKGFGIPKQNHKSSGGPRVLYGRVIFSLC
jgi:Amidases related to nicotinamidase